MLFPYLVLVFGASALAKLSRRFTVSDTSQGTVDSGVITDCTYWVNVQSGDSCSGIQDYFSLTSAQFTGYNPALKSDCSGLTVGHAYCVEENYGREPVSTSSSSSRATTTTPGSTGSSATTTTPISTVPSPTQSGLISTCKTFYKVQTGDICQSVVDQYGTFTLSDFYAWNPAVGSSCTGLQVGVYVCIGIPTTPTAKPTTTASSSSGPTPVQSGIVSGCKSYYKVVAGDGCQAIVDQYKTFTLSQFYTWNPAVGSSCNNLQAGYYVCVGIASTPTAPVTTSSPTTSSTVLPSPTQTGIISTCNKYAKSGASDTCSSLASSKSISLAQLYAWNSVLGYHGENCNKLLANAYYCTGVSAPLPAPGEVQAGVIDTCIQYAKSGSSGTRSSFATSNNIAVSDLYTWNSVLGASGGNCQTSFWANEYYCVAVAGPTVVEPNTPRQSGIISTCNKYLKSNPDGSCAAFPGRAGISSAQSYAWNSILGYKGENCASKFLPNTYYCTEVSGPLPAPGAVQSGVIDTCIKYAISNPAATCSAFATNQKITLAQLYAWNSVLGSSGQNCQTQFWASEYYCVAVAG